jgi:hypothetical protein
LVGSAVRPLKLRTDLISLYTILGSTKEPNLLIKEGEKVLLVVDDIDLVHFILNESTNMNFKQKELYNETKSIAEFKGKDIQYGLGNYLHTTVDENPAIDKGIEIRSNFWYLVNSRIPTIFLPYDIRSRTR